jgi:metallo-beta-lactamase family protein
LKEDGKTTRLTFSGDVGRYNDAILRPPDEFPQADYIILESTYGDSLHKDVEGTKEAFYNWINETCNQKKGKLIIPAFSVGRTQEILYYLNELENEGRLPKVKYYVDSPLSREATDVVESHPENFNTALQQLLKSDKDPFQFNGLTYVGSVDESKAINEYTHPCVIISASGMADAGRVKHHIKNNISDARNTVLLAGYASPYSLGGKLMNGAKRVNIYGDEYDVKAEIGSIRSMSAHGDYEDLFQVLAAQQVTAVKTIFLVHGEYDVQQTFAKKLSEKGFAVEIPGMHFSIQLA